MVLLLPVVAMLLQAAPEVREGQPAPAFAVVTDNGKRITETNFGGKLLVLNFWHTSCAPCVKELPSLTAFAREFAKQGVVVVAVSADEDAAKYRKFLRRHKVNLQTTRDPDLQLSKSYGSEKFPETFLVQDGVIIRKVIGPRDWMDREMRSFVSLRLAQPNGQQIYEAFLAWKNTPNNKTLSLEQATDKYRGKLTAGGIDPNQAAKAVSIITARDEGVFYDSIYANPSRQFITAPNRLLVEAAADRKPGRALDVGMGQGRNAIHLARLGWDVTGFDTSRNAVAEAQRLASVAGVKLHAVVASDEEFNFGTEDWDLIALIYPIEKRSVYRVRQALRPGGIVVVECSHKDGAGAPFEYETNELLKIFAGFRIIKYEEVVAEHDWARKQLRLVRLIARK